MKRNIDTNVPNNPLIDMMIDTIKNLQTKCDEINRNISIQEKEINALEKELGQNSFPYFLIFADLITFIIGYAITDSEKDMIVNTIIGNINRGTIAGLNCAGITTLLLIIAEYKLKKERKIYIYNSKEKLTNLKMLKNLLEKNLPEISEQELKQITKDFLEQSYETKINLTEPKFEPEIIIPKEVINSKTITEKNYKNQKMKAKKKTIA